MKKTLAMLLAVVMVSALCGMMFVSAESANLAAGKEVQNAAVNGVNGGYNANLTDGVAADTISFDGNWFAFYYHADKTNEENQEIGANSVEGVASPTIDLGAVYALDQVRINTFLGNNSGIAAPSAISVEVSTDGETYTKLDEKTFDMPNAESEDATKVAWVEFDVDVEAQYVRINLTHVITWVFVNEIEVYGAAAGGNDEPPVDDDPVEEVKTYDETLVQGEDGNYTCGVPYGYTWNINYVDGTIAGEDNTICTTQEAYLACNPNWAITIYAEKQADGTYVALKDAIVTPGSAEAAGITLGENQIAIVAHSAYSHPEGANWESKVVAMSVKAGDVFEINEEKTTVYAVVPGAENKEPSKPVTPGGDAGILVFAVLGVVAVCGAAVTIKARG